MRAFLISSALAVAVVAMPVMASESREGGAPVSLLPVEPEAVSPPSRLAPLAVDSAWTPRFEAAAGELAAALSSRDEARWGPLLGGQWLTPAERARVKGLLDDRNSPFHALLSKGSAHRAILGWDAVTPLSADERAAIEGGKEAEALVCWSAGGAAEPVWPVFANDADNRSDRPYACARIAYSIRGNVPTWRAFIEQGEGGAIAAAALDPPA